MVCFNKDKMQQQDMEIKRLQEDNERLSNLNNSLIESGKYRTEFFSDISHELKTPINTILGAIQLIEQRKNILNDENKLIKHISIMKINCYRLLRLINNILDLTKPDSSYNMESPINCNIVSLVEEITQSVSSYAEQKGITLLFDTEFEEILMEVYADKIERIILNLLSNAIKFTKEDGSICIGVTKSKNEAFISVKDTGIGIPKYKQKDIFKRFHHICRGNTGKFQSSGIGLYLVKSFVDLHGGSIRVISEENRGSEFIIRLPIKLCKSDKSSNLKIDKGISSVTNAVDIEFSSNLYPLTKNIIDSCLFNTENLKKLP